MADDNKQKKSKIDLKARLGKTSMTAAGGAAVPLPVPGSQPGSGPPPDVSSAPAATPSARPSASGRPSAPAGIAPPPGISPGIPLPPFAQRPAAQAAPKPTAVQQTIKVEVGEEVEHERKKLIKKFTLYAGIAAVVGIGMGFVAGGAKERSDRGKAAVDGAALLEKDIKSANDKMKELSEKLVAASKQFGEKSYPKEFAQELAALNIPFDTLMLEGKQVGNLPGKVMRQVFNYTQAVTDLNKKKDALRNVLGALQPQVEKAWKEEKEPVVNFSVVFKRDGDKMVAELVPNKEPFPYGKAFPEKYKVTRPERTQQGIKGVEKDAVRWTKGDLTGNDLIAIPIDPPTVAAFTAEQAVNGVKRAMLETHQILEGSPDDPTAPPGLLKTGEDLANELHKIALKR
jgi:hypothetical protein